MTPAHYIKTQDLLRSRRLTLGLSQAEVSKRMGRGGRYISDLERPSKRVPSFETVAEWGSALGLVMKWETIDADQE